MNNAKRSFFFSHFFEILLSIPKTVFFNFRVLPFSKALKFPFAVSYHVKVRGVNRKNVFVTGDNMGFASMRIGFGDSLVGYRESKKALLEIRNGGKIVLGGKIGISQGAIIVVDNSTLKIGDNFRCNYSCTIDCSKTDIQIGNNVVLGWKVFLKNNDGHLIFYSNGAKTESKPIVIGNHVWICAEASVLKGVNLLDDCVVAYGTVLTRTINESGVLYGGNPSIVIKKNISWKE